MRNPWPEAGMRGHELVLALLLPATLSQPAPTPPAPDGLCYLGCFTTAHGSYGWEGCTLAKSRPPGCKECLYGALSRCNLASEATLTLAVLRGLRSGQRAPRRRPGEPAPDAVPGEVQGLELLRHRGWYRLLLRPRQPDRRLAAAGREVRHLPGLTGRALRPARGTRGKHGDVRYAGLLPERPVCRLGFHRGVCRCGCTLPSGRQRDGTPADWGKRSRGFATP